MPAERLESLFVVRHHILDNLMSSVKELPAKPPDARSSTASAPASWTART